jgi:hypothetical protein
MFEQTDSVAQTREVSKTSETLSYDKIMKDFDPKTLINGSEAVCSTKNILPDLVIEKCVVPPGPNNIKKPPQQDFEPGTKPQPHCDKGPLKETGRNAAANFEKDTSVQALLTPIERAYGPR